VQEPLRAPTGTIATVITATTQNGSSGRPRSSRIEACNTAACRRAVRRRSSVWASSILCREFRIRSRLGATPAFRMAFSAHAGQHDYLSPSKFEQGAGSKSKNWHSQFASGKLINRSRGTRPALKGTAEPFGDERFESSRPPPSARRSGGALHHSAKPSPRRSLPARVRTSKSIFG
jgi:hypothetical protein